jgi:hypothetical protein
LWEHWDEPAIKWFRGSHIGFFLSRPVGKFLSDALRDSGLVSDVEATGVDVGDDVAEFNAGSTSHPDNEAACSQ